ncbi:MAG: carboxypeptidase regulatory-like domain-containing protein [Acidobacteria bacterium]|nr:MAG: carboxypeptidase regulatory-like domain-containing protein [Acidobacteriota bacterium]
MAIPQAPSAGRAGLALTLAALALGPAAVAAQSSPPVPDIASGGAEIRLPLQRYDALLQEIERADAARAERLAAIEEPAAERLQVDQRIEVRGDGVHGTVRATVRVAGQKLLPVRLPLIGLVRAATVTPAGASLAHREGSLTLLAERAGVYRLEVETFVPFADDAAAVREVELVSGDAPVGSTVVRFGAELQWQCPGATVVRDEVDGQARVLELAIPGGTTATLRLRQPYQSAEAERALVQTITATVLDVQRQGIGRTDLAVYQVIRGEIATHVLDLPAGLQPESVVSDEGGAQSSRDAGQLQVYRQRLLRGTGFVKLHTPLRHGERIDLQPVATGPGTSALGHYLVTRTSIASEVAPPAGSWRRLDVSDLPASPSWGAGTGIAAVWQLDAEAGAAPGTLTVELLPEAEDVGAVVRRRESTSLLTDSGSLVHRDVFQVVGRSSALEVRLPPGSELWSLLVDDSPTRPLESGGTVFVPLSLDNDGTRSIELVSVQAGALPSRRSEITLQLATLETPVLEHRWRLLLPDGREYRYAGGVLRPTFDAISDAGSVVVGGGEGSVRGRVRDDSGYLLPGVAVTLRVRDRPYRTFTDRNGWFTFRSVPDGRHYVHAELSGFGAVGYDVRVRRGRTSMVDLTLAPATQETITVTSEAPLLDEMQVQSMFEDDAAEQRQQAFREEASALKRDGSRREDAAGRAASAPAAAEPEPRTAGRTGGVRPLPVDIPARGKILQMIGILPPREVAVTLEVREPR